MEMNDIRPLASLSPSLLARKGGARPAMRRPMASPEHHAGGQDLADSTLDDLGWNDMGHDVRSPVDNPALAGRLSQAIPPARLVTGSTPEVRRQQDEISAKLNAPAEAAPATLQLTMAAEVTQPPAAPSQTTVVKIPAPVPTAERKGSGPAGKAAFTLRLDPERHLRLRLATAVKGVSAQRLVLEALDVALRKIPELEALVDNVAGRTNPQKHAKQAR